jgi:hypothetical protein
LRGGISGDSGILLRNTSNGSQLVSEVRRLLCQSNKQIVSKLTRLVKKRIWIAVAAMFLVAVGGAFAGYMLGSAAIWRTTQEDLTQDAQIAGDQNPRDSNWHAKASVARS